jgi:hypothetical protein
MGILFFTMAVVVLSVSECLSKIVFVKEDGLSVVEFCFFRFTIQFIFMLLLINKNIKHVLWDCVPKDLILSLNIRVFAGLASFYC